METEHSFLGDKEWLLVLSNGMCVSSAQGLLTRTSIAGEEGLCFHSILLRMSIASVWTTLD